MGSEVNGRDSVSANGGRALNFEDVPPELMAAVEVDKNPSAEHIEGGEIGGLVNLAHGDAVRFPGQKFSVSLSDNYLDPARRAASRSASVLFSDRWNLGDAGEFGALIDLAHSDSWRTRTDALQVSPYFEHPVRRPVGLGARGRGLAPGWTSTASATASTARCNGRTARSRRR